MHFLFFVHSSHGEALQDLEWCEEHPLGGSETAVLRMATALRELGHSVELITEGEKLLTASADVFISCRHWQPFVVARMPGEFNYLWCHDDVNQPMVKDLAIKEVGERVFSRCDGVILLSQFHCQRWVDQFHVPLNKIFLSSNAVALERFKVDVDSLHKRPPRAYFSSVPWRGLQQTLDLWPMVRGAIPTAELVILSSLKVYGMPEVPEMEKLYERAKNTPGVIYRGSVGQRELREVAMTCRALAYPCVFPETSCITAMEAMAAGAVVVSSSLGALPETAWRNPLVQPGVNWGNTWAFELARVFVDTDYYLDIARQNLALSQFNTWKHVAERWLRRIRSDRILHAHEKAA